MLAVDPRERGGRPSFDEDVLERDRLGSTVL